MYIHRFIIIFIMFVGLLSCINDSEIQTSIEEASPAQPPNVSSEEKETKDDNKPEEPVTQGGEFAKYDALTKNFTPKQEEIINKMPFSDRIKNKTEVFGGLFLVIDIEE